MNKRLFFTGFFIFLLSDAMCGKTVFASHHKPQIAFVSWRDGNSEIYVMDADGNNQIRLTNHPEEDSSPSWSPDGARIAFVSNRNGGNRQIYVMDSNGKNVKTTDQWQFGHESGVVSGRPNYCLQLGGRGALRDNPDCPRWVESANTGWGHPSA